MTNVKAREEIILELSDKFLDVVKETSGKQSENVSLLEVIIACGALQAALFEKGHVIR